MTLVLDWNGIRPLNGSRASGFEELCAQLGRAESPKNSRFERKGTPDAGVECYAVLIDGSEWGWQAKYIDGLGQQQWSQIDDSVKTALEKHPLLVRYYVCAPIDRPDARLARQRSARQRWDDHVKKWTRWAADRGMTVQFIWWGSHELLERLSKPYEIGRLRFWFDIRGFDKVWFSSRLDEALKAAGPRYTPEINIDLPIASELDAFGRTETFFDRVKAHARDIRKKLREMEYSVPKAPPSSLESAISAVSEKVNAVIEALCAVVVQATGDLPFKGITSLVAEAEGCICPVNDLLSDLQLELEEQYSKAGDLRAPTPFNSLNYAIHRLTWQLQNTQNALEHADAIAGSSLLLLNGPAGTGKTHLLCDVAKERIAAGRPTVLLMGQRFISSEPPWTQVVQQLDLPGLSAEEFVGALEAAAQAAGSRALILIDAINEGSGRLIWPSHLAPFLAYVERSSWISVLLSVRSSYEENVVPEEIRARAVTVTHHGFADHEYNATRAFFLYYGLELPTTPLLTPEFSNPLFLKTLCCGLMGTVEKRLPRGYHGITATFNLYLQTINRRLAGLLDYNPKDFLVSRSLDAFAAALVDSGKRWISLGEAEKVVNALLPGREYERSLYRALVSEGVLIEEISIETSSMREEVVMIAYERFADHLVTRIMLDAHLDVERAEAAFAAEGPLQFVCDTKQFVPAGIIEAMSIQIPERTGKELVDLAPEIRNRWKIWDAFRQSLLWRDTGAFSERTQAIFNECIFENYGLETFELLLTVAMLPEHPFNAKFLHKKLRSEKMADRDAYWSTYLHRAYGNKGSVDRLCDWASSVTPDGNLDDDAVNLCVTTLSWMLSSSNRFLRDRITKSVVALLTNRVDAAVSLLKQFSDVDDPYVSERIYAIAYGVATRNNDPERVGLLAKYVYSLVFEAGSPPPHILLRDYARGVVERAIYLNARINVDPAMIRPPYKSTWPHIPTEDEIKPLLPDWSRGSYASGEREWARNRIGTSVMSDDFARYVLGTNSSSTLDKWLAVPLDEPVWRSTKEQLEDFVAGLPETAVAAWNNYEDAERELQRATLSSSLRKILKTVTQTEVKTETEQVEVVEGASDAIARLRERRAKTLAFLKIHLSSEQIVKLDELLLAKENEQQRPPGFELGGIQRYILWRVFDLGWNTKRFGEFDRFYVETSGREAFKAERIGKKYQWIAYFEILAFISDHYQYHERYYRQESMVYDGPWQDNLRDIDPTCTLRAARGGTSWHGHTPAWWGATRYNEWEDEGDRHDWLIRPVDLPRAEELIICRNPDDNSLWVNLNGFFLWENKTPTDDESSDFERRTVWYRFTAYLIPTESAGAFMDWARTRDTWGREMPEPPSFSQMFLGEHCWSPAWRHFQHPYFGDDGWIEPEGFPVKVRAMAAGYKCSPSGFDCSVQDHFELHVPACEILAGLNLHWTGKNAEYADEAGNLAAFDPTASLEGPSALLIREELLRNYLAQQGLSVIWKFEGEKQIIGQGVMPKVHSYVNLSGAFMLQNGDAVGFVELKNRYD